MTEQEKIARAHPFKTDRHDLYDEARRLVGERHEKGDLVDLVNWLLYERELAIDLLSTFVQKNGMQPNSEEYFDLTCVTCGKDFDWKDREWFGHAYDCSYIQAHNLVVEYSQSKEGMWQRQATSEE